MPSPEEASQHIPEEQTNQEAERKLSEAIQDVIPVYLHTKRELPPDEQGEDPHDSYWENAANKHPDYSKEIQDLGAAIQVAKNIKKAYGYPNTYGNFSTLLIRQAFVRVENTGAKELLTDVLFSRMAKWGDKQYAQMDYGLKPETESKSMANEMGVGEWNSPQAREVTLNKVMRNVLQGNLRVKYQPPQPTTG